MESQTQQIAPIAKNPTGLILTEQLINKPQLAILSENFPKLKNTDANELSKLINYLLTILNIQRPNDEETIELMDYQMLLVGDLLRTKFGNLTIPEVQEAFKMYVAREFPSLKIFRVFDSIAIGEVLTAYRDYRDEMLHVYNTKKMNLLINKPKDYSEEEKQQIRNEFLMVLFDEIKEKGYSDDVYHLWTDEVGNLTIFAKKVNTTVTDDQKKEIYKTELEFYINQKKGDVALSRSPAARIILEDIKRMAENNEIIKVVQNRCRCIIACKYLKNHLADFEQFKMAIYGLE